MTHSFSWKAAIRSAGQEIFRLFRKPKLLIRVYTTSTYAKFLLVVSSLLAFCAKIMFEFLIFPILFAGRLMSSPLIHVFQKYMTEIINLKFLVMTLQPPLIAFPLTPNILLHIRFSDVLNLWSSKTTFHTSTNSVFPYEILTTIQDIAVPQKQHSIVELERVIR